MKLTFVGRLLALSAALGLGLSSLNGITSAWADQVIQLEGDAAGKRFDGIGAVSGGGATSVLLKDYPERQRGQILDLLFKPKFGASMSSLLVEVPGDGNSTQGSEPSHMHRRDDINYGRGYEWWLMREAKKRNPALMLDACAWGCPGWVGGGKFWSQDMCDYYVKWIMGLKAEYGVDLDAIGCRNEKGVNEAFAIKLKATLRAAGLGSVQVHGFDNWGKTKFDWCADMKTNEELRKAIDIISNHTMSEVGTPEDVKDMAENLGKPIWNTEEHVYKRGFDCEISLVQAFNENYLKSGVTRIVNWYLVGSVYGIEPYDEEPAAMMANTPWSGRYYVRPVLWGYAHYGQFTEVGWKYLKGACCNLNAGGTLVALKSPGEDFSVIAETKDAKEAQTVAFRIGAGLSTGALCVWRSSADEQFAQQEDIAPENGSFTIVLKPNSIYSISTTKGQQKGCFGDVPRAKSFPFPYRETFDEYSDPKQWGYLPHYTADIAGVFEIAERPDKSGMCLKQVVDKKAQSWAPEWMPYTIIGDENWRDYEVSADVCLEQAGWAGVMGRVNNTGSGFGCVPRAYYMRLGSDGKCGLYAATQEKDAIDGKELAETDLAGDSGRQWHNLKMQFAGHTITGVVDGAKVLTVTNSLYASGMAGLVTGGAGTNRNTALFGNLIVKAVGATMPPPTVFAQDQSPIYTHEH